MKFTTLTALLGCACATRLTSLTEVDAETEIETEGRFETHPPFDPSVFKG